MSDASKTLRTAADLAAAGLVSAKDAAGLAEVAARYAVAVTPAMTELIRRADPDDPIARQFLPNSAELRTDAHELADPIGDDAHSPVPGIVHRYRDRVLLKLVHVCAVYCRFCFRRTMVGPGKERGLSRAQSAAALSYVREHAEIWEVILTGGDPLVLSAARLRAVLEELGAIDHVKVVRIHTRMPVADPACITPSLVRALGAAGKATYVVLHANHPRELSAAAREACGRIVDAGLPMLSQSVLLRGVNDDAATLEALMRAFVESRIKPYYLHQGDLAPGTAHLRTAVVEGQALLRELQANASGLCQPAYVLDIPGGHGKVPIGPTYIRRDGSRRYAVTDQRGGTHRYEDRAAPQRPKRTR